jgi:hypothetical protein
MFKKLIAIAFVLLVPMQAMAALTMNLQMQALQSTASASPQAAVHHPCHAEVSSMSAAAPEEAAAVNPSGCYSCALCMAFGLNFDSFILVTADHLTQSVPQFTQALVSADLTSLSKPPIL